MVPEDFKVHSAWVESYGGQTIKVAWREDDEEEAEYREMGWGPFSKRLIAILAGIAGVVIVCLLALAVANGVYQAVFGTVCHVFPTLPAPRATP